MERSEEYEPIILDLQKSKVVQQSRRYVFFVVIAVAVVLGTVATFAAFYYPKPSPNNRAVTPATPVPRVTPTPKATPTLAVTPTPVAAVATPVPMPTPTTQPTPPVVVPEATGTLNLNSEPANAEVLIDGKLIGHTPLLNYTLKPGTYTVKFSHQGTIAEHKITITAGKTTEYTYRFEGLSALSIQTTRSGSDIFINGELAGQSPLLLEGLAPGTYKIVARKPGYATAEKTVTLGKGERQELLITIKPLDWVTEPDRTPMPPRPQHPSERRQP